MRRAWGWPCACPEDTVLRAGFGMNYTVGEYATFANTMAHQPPFTDEQTNEESVGNAASTSCVKTASCFTLASGFPIPRRWAIMRSTLTTACPT